MDHHLFGSMVAFWPLVDVGVALFCHLDSSREVNELKRKKLGNNNEVGKQILI